MDKKSIQQKDGRITILHIIGMVMILLCHFFQQAKVYFVSEILISGVPLFLFVSGYLCGQKNIGSPLHFIARKARRVLTPYYLFLFTIFIIFLIIGVDLINWNSFFLLTNLQGINYLYWKFESYGAPVGLGHLWFVTVIMLCYVLVPCFQTLKNKYSKNVDLTGKVTIILGVIALQFLFVLIGVQLNYLIIFFLGYFTKCLQCNFKKMALISIIVGMIVALRLVIKQYYDGTIFYDRYLSLISNSAIAIWIVYFVVWLFDKYVSLKRFFDNSIVIFTEKISYYVFLVHYVFLRGPYPISDYINNVFVADSVVVILSVIVASLMYLLIDKLIFGVLVAKKKS